MKRLFIIALAICVSTAFAQNTKKTEPITIEFGNMKSKKPELVQYAENLKKRSDNSSPDYTSRYFSMINTMKIVGTKNLTAKERDLILAVKQPTEEAINRYLAEKDEAAKRADAKSASIEKWRTDVLQREQQQKLAQIEAKKAQEEREAERQKQAEINAIEERKAEALEKQARMLQRLATRY